MNVDFTQETVGVWDCVNALMKIRLPHRKELSSLEGLLYIEVTLELFIVVLKNPVK